MACQDLDLGLLYQNSENPGMGGGFLVNQHVVANDQANAVVRCERLPSTCRAARQERHDNQGAEEAANSHYESRCPFSRR
jgi:hypothetical protein